jgi:hypothetical protein
VTSTATGIDPGVDAVVVSDGGAHPPATNAVDAAAGSVDAAAVIDSWGRSWPRRWQR